MQTWLRDLQSLVDNVPFGEVTPTIIRHRNQVTQVKVGSLETIRYEDNEKALADIQQLFNNLFEAQYDGELIFRVIMEKGVISRIAYYNQRSTNYSEIKHGQKTKDSPK
jgi:hypothetical protein